MGIYISMELSENNSEVDKRPNCSKCNDNVDVFIDKVKFEQEKMKPHLQTIMFFCAACANYIGPFNCDLKLKEIQIPTTKTITEITVNDIFQVLYDISGVR